MFFVSQDFDRYDRPVLFSIFHENGTPMATGFRTRAAAEERMARDFNESIPRCRHCGERL